jgi:hypothetical protein
MFEAVVTFVKIEEGYPITQVYRLEFETEEAFRVWKDSADTVNMETLVAWEPQ